MIADTNADEKSEGRHNAEEYQEYLRVLDSAVCEAIAVSQACAGRFEAPATGYSTHVFTRICAHSQAMMCAAPNSRWVKRDFEIWDVSTIASHARSVLEGYLLFRYLVDAPDDLETQRAFVQVMHLYDCKKRIKILPHVLPAEDIEGFHEQEKIIIGRLKDNSFFSRLDRKHQKELLLGRRMMITPQKELLHSLGIRKEDFDFFWNYLSQYTHVLSFTFYRIEPNSRGTGVENGFDRDALCMVMDFCRKLLTAAVDRLVEVFPDAGVARNGVGSKFSPGPSSNLPKDIKRRRKKWRWF